MDNYQLKEGTFLYGLVEEATFHEAYFWNYYNAQIEINKQTINKSLDRELTKIVHWVHKRIHDLLLCHFIETNVYSIAKLPESKLIYFTERLDFMMEGYFGNFVMSEKQFGDDIKNPNYPELYKN
ncbi:immunity 41 family protein [Paenibacillus sp. ATY16]|nr:immunity 41 family protein [Paenibacillus sp. ATY16]